MNSLGIHYFFREFTLNPLFFSRIHHQFTICSRIRYESINFLRIALNLLSLSRIQYGYFLFLANSLCINYLFGEVSPSRIHYEFLIFFANSLSIHYLFGAFTMAPLIFRVFTLNLLFLSRIHYHFTI